MYKFVVSIVMCLMVLPSMLRAEEYVIPGQFIGEQTLVSFWRNDCGACAKQIPILISLAKLNPKVHIALVTLSGRNGSQVLPSALPSNMQLHSVLNSATSLRAFGSSQDSLPFSAFLRSDGSVCESHAGVQGQATMEEWIKKC